MDVILLVSPIPILLPVLLMNLNLFSFLSALQK